MEAPTHFDTTPDVSITRDDGIAITGDDIEAFVAALEHGVFAEMYDSAVAAMRQRVLAFGEPPSVLEDTSWLD